MEGLETHPRGVGGEGGGVGRCGSWPRGAKGGSLDGTRSSSSTPPPAWVWFSQETHHSCLLLSRPHNPA